MQRHDTDAVSLTFALILLGIANAWLMVVVGAADVAGLRWFFPALLLGAGAAGVVSSLLRGRRSGPSNLIPDEPAPDADAVVDTPGGQS
ncbi:MAG TPA: hypothetical protein VMZ00_00890 [Sporichthya sp.]|nr:hypothetical protein [Sporichthya sp.]